MKQDNKILYCDDSDKVIIESKEIVKEKYPNLGGRYFSIINDMDMNKIISCNMSDTERNELFSYVDAGNRKVVFKKAFPRSVRIGMYQFDESIYGFSTFNVTRVEDSVFSMDKI
jgi:hypothetical protein